MNSNYKRLVNSTLILSIGVICTKLFTFLLVPFYTRWLTQNDYGVYDLIITYTSLIVPVITLDLAEAVFRFLLENLSDKARSKTIVSTAIKFTLIFYTLGVCVGIPLLSRYIDVELSVLVMLLLLVEILNTLFMMVLRGIKKLTTYAISSVVFILVTFALNFFFIKMLGLGLKGIIIAYILGYTVSIIYMFVDGGMKNYISLKHTELGVLKNMLKYSLPLIPNAISWWIISASDRTIVASFLGVSSSAIIAVAHKVPNICQTMYSVFHLSWQENASDTVNLPKAERDAYYSSIFNQMLSILTTIQIVVLSVNFLFYRYMVELDYFQGYFLSPILVVSLSFSMIAQFFGGIYIATKETAKNGVSTFISAVLNTVFHLVLVRTVGIFAAPISTLLSYIVLVLIRFFDIKKSIAITMEKKNVGLLVMMMYFFASIYINSPALNICNLFLAALIFALVNRTKIGALLAGLIGKLRTM